MPRATGFVLEVRGPLLSPPRNSDFSASVRPSSVRPKNRRWLALTPPLVRPKPPSVGQGNRSLPDLFHYLPSTIRCLRERANLLNSLVPMCTQNGPYV